MRAAWPIAVFKIHLIMFDFILDGDIIQILRRKIRSAQFGNFIAISKFHNFIGAVIN